MKHRDIIWAYFFVSFILVMIGVIFRDSFNVLTWTITIQLFAVLIVNKMSGKLFSVSTIFIVLVYLFHCSQSLIVTLGFNDPYYHRSVIALSTNAEYSQASVFVLICIAIYGLSCVNVSNRFEKEKCETYGTYDSTDALCLSSLYNIGVLVFAVCVIPLVYSDLQKITALKNGSYLDTYTTYSSGIGMYMSFLGKFGRASISIILLSLSNKPTKARIFFLTSSIYFAIMMVSGDRGTNMIYIITNFFIYYRFISKPNFKTIVISLVVGYYLMGFVSAISLFRHKEFSLASFLSVFDARSEDGIIYSCLREFGATMQSLVYSIRYIPSYNGYNYGLTYITSLLLIVPKWPRSITTILGKSFAFTNAFPPEVTVGLGGSVLAELYYNFGWSGAVFFYLIGHLISKFDLSFDQYRKNKEWNKIGIIVSFLPQVFMWTRDFFASVVFIGFWMGVLLYFFRMNNNSIKNS